MKNKFVLLSFGVVILFVVYDLALNYLYPISQERGLFGDSYGALNTFFSGLAFLGIIYTIHLQKTELQLQRKELKETRKELTRSAEAQERSERALSKQAESLKMTAKLNGLSSLLQFELSKPSTIKKLEGHNVVTSNFADYFSVDEARRIKNQIEDIISGK
ncbi:MAG: hypothetical protein RLZZ480_90 [Candidatus Parcubacteria bacterium]|jgi:FtsZ-binding cell division protein ZapB